MTEGALADLILVDGDPVADISLIARPDEAFTAIIKDGQLVKGPSTSYVRTADTNRLRGEVSSIPSGIPRP